MQMNRQRWLPPSDFTDQRVARLPAAVRVTMSGLRLYVDDWGRAEVRLRMMLAALYEHDEQVSTSDLESHLLMLDDAHWLRLYTDDWGRSLLQIRVWPAVQHPDARGSEFPPPRGFMKPSRRSQETFTVEERGRARASESASAGEWVSGGERASGERPSRTPTYEQPAPGPSEPSPFCSQHQPFGTEDACGPCGTAREALHIWRQASRAVSLARPSERGPRFGPDLGEPEEYITPDGLIDHT